MTLEETRTPRNAWIPWVLALVALLGLNAICGDYTRARRDESPDGVGLSLAAKDNGSVGRMVDPVVLAPPGPRLEAPSNVVVAVRMGRIADGDAAPSTLRRGAMQGRAPPRIA